MNADARPNSVINATLIITLAVFGIISYIGPDSFWGINHLHFLPIGFAVAYGLIFIVLVLIQSGLLPFAPTNRPFETINALLWGKGKLPRLIFSLVFVILFVAFRISVPLLGDSWTWLAIFGHGQSYILKWTEPGAILILRAVQWLLGGYTRETALTAFQIISIASGAIFIYNMISVTGRLCRTVFGRVLALATIFFSGAILLFFGYIEFYPMVWAAVSVFLNMAIRYLENDKFLWAVLVSYVFCVLLHLQALYFLPAVAFLLINSVSSVRLRKILWYLFGLSVVGGVFFLVWLQSARIDFQILILPLFHGRPPADDYAVFSLPHLVDLLNITVLIFPGALSLLAVWYFSGAKKWPEPVHRFFLFLSSGSLLFLIFFGAGITMGRDWDIMSLSLLPPALLVLSLIDRSRPELPHRFLFGYILVTGFMTASFLATAIASRPAEIRFKTLLNNRNMNGWVIYANYFLLKGDEVRFGEIMKERTELFPELVNLQSAYSYIDKGQYDRAVILAEKLLAGDPYNPDYLQIVGNLYGKKGQYPEAENFYLKALRIRPYSSVIMNELGQLYMKEGKYDPALEILIEAHTLAPEHNFIIESLALAEIYKRNLDAALNWADTLFIRDKNSPGGHLVRMSVALQKGDINTAREQYEQYLKYGVGRSDYERIREYYKYLTN